MHYIKMHYIKYGPVRDLSYDERPRKNCIFIVARRPAASGTHENWTHRLNLYLIRRVSRTHTGASRRESCLFN